MSTDFITGQLATIDDLSGSLPRVAVLCADGRVRETWLQDGRMTLREFGGGVVVTKLELGRYLPAHPVSGLADWLRDTPCEHQREGYLRMMAERDAAYDLASERRSELVYQTQQAHQWEANAEAAEELADEWRQRCAGILQAQGRIEDEDEVDFLARAERAEARAKDLQVKLDVATAMLVDAEAETEAECARAERAELAIKEIRKLHAYGLGQMCQACSTDGIGHVYPCPTIRALDALA